MSMNPDNPSSSQKRTDIASRLSIRPPLREPSQLSGIDEIIDDFLDTNSRQSNTQQPTASSSHDQPTQGNKSKDRDPAILTLLGTISARLDRIEAQNAAILRNQLELKQILPRVLSSSSSNPFKESTSIFNPQA